MGQKTTDVMVQSQHEFMVERVSQKGYVDGQHSAQFVSARYSI